MMPGEYEALVAALKQTDIPFAEYGWRTRPEGTCGVVSLDGEEDSLDGDGEKLDRAWEATVDVFFRKLADRNSVVSTVESVLAAVCGAAWYLNSIQYENDTGLFHMEWVCEVTDEPATDDDSDGTEIQNQGESGNQAGSGS